MLLKKRAGTLLMSIQARPFTHTDDRTRVPAGAAPAPSPHAQGQANPGACWLAHVKAVLEQLTNKGAMRVTVGCCWASAPTLCS